jgi:hypothetical protein
LFIRSVQAPSATGGTCTYVADPSQPTLFYGQLDAALSNRYEAILLVGNQMTPQGDPVQARTETSRIELQYAVVRITDAYGTQLNTYTTVTAGTVDPASGSTPEYTTVAVEAVDPSTVAKFLPGGTGLPSNDPPITVNGSSVQVIAYIQLFGQTLGGQNVSSNDFEFPIQICAGCLVQGISNDVCAVTSSASTEVPCNLGQDLPVSCSLCNEPYCMCGALSCSGGANKEPNPDAGPG